jgi:hypothetical protein
VVLAHESLSRRLRLGPGDHGAHAFCGLNGWAALVPIEGYSGPCHQVSTAAALGGREEWVVP